MASEVQYLGHKITKEDIEPTEDKANAFAQVLPCLNSVSGLKSFLDLVNSIVKSIHHI